LRWDMERKVWDCWKGRVKEILDWWGWMARKDSLQGVRNGL
jgi:hypothetical protein